MMRRYMLLPQSTLNDEESAEEEDGIRLTEDDLDVSFYKGDEIDLGELVREELILELESCPSCSLDSCEGAAYLRRLAEEAESFEDRDAVDPRWAALAEMKSNFTKK